MTRLVNRLLVFLIGVALAAGGALVIIEVIATGTGSGFVWVPGDQWLASVETTAWSATIVVAVSVAVAAVGLALLVFEARPHPKRTAPFPTDGTGDWFLLRRSTEAHLTRRLAAEVPVAVKAKLTPKRTRWALKVHAKGAASAREALQSAGRSELGRLHAPQRSKVKITTSGNDKASPQ